MSFHDILEQFNRIARAYAPEYVVGEKPAPRASSDEAQHPDGTPNSAPPAEARAEAPSDGPVPERHAANVPDHNAFEREQELNRLRREAAATAHASGVWSVATACAALGLPATADRAAVTAAYRALIIRYHPDHSAGLPPAEQEAARRRAVELNAAYAFLKARLAG